MENNYICLYKSIDIFSGGDYTFDSDESRLYGATMWRFNMHLEQEILAGLKALSPDLDALTTCNTGSMRYSAPHGRCRVALQQQAANRVDGT